MGRSCRAPGPDVGAAVGENRGTGPPSGVNVLRVLLSKDLSLRLVAQFLAQPRKFASQAETAPGWDILFTLRCTQLCSGRSFRGSGGRGGEQVVAGFPGGLGVRVGRVRAEESNEQF